MKKIFGLIFFVLFVFLFSSSSMCFAEPIIDVYPDTILDGNNIIIKGRFFGQKKNSAPLAFVNSYNKINGTLISEPALVDVAKKYYYDGTQSHSKGHSIKTKVQRWPNGGTLYFDYGAGGSDEVYFTFWTRLDFLVGDDISTGGAQIKWYCIRGTSPIATGAGYGGYSWFHGVDGILKWKNMVDSTVYSNSYQNTVYWTPYQPSENTWFRVEIYGKRASGPNVKDGTWITKCFDPTNGRVATIVNSNNEITHVDGDPSWRYAMWRNEITNAAGAESQSEIDMWIDDIYIDNTSARVEIGNKPVFNDCDHREIQIPIKWNPRIGNEEKIKFIANKGSLTSSTAYLFVVDEKGVPSKGKLINLK